MDSFDLPKLEKAMEVAVFNSKGTCIQKLKKAPIKLLYSKILELITVGAKKPIKIKAKTFWDRDMFVIIPEPVSLNIYRYGFFEEDLTRMILEYLKPGMVFLDIGSHYGYFTLLSSFIVGDRGQVHSFEPIPSTFNILKANVSNKDNVFRNNNAVFSKSQIISINDYGLKYSAYNSIYNARLSQKILKEVKLNRYEVEAFSVDEYVQEKDVIPNFIKIDAESSEYEILRGMKKTMDNFHPIISIEVGDVDVKGVPTSRDLIDVLVKKDYQPYEFNNGKILRHVHKYGPYQYNNILFLPG